MGLASLRRGADKEGDSSLSSQQPLPIPRPFSWLSLPQPTGSLLCLCLPPVIKTAHPLSHRGSLLCGLGGITDWSDLTNLPSWAAAN